MDSPCIKLCVIDERLQLCKGCWRSLDEIARWSTLSDAERRRIIAVLADRQQLHESVSDESVSDKRASKNQNEPASLKETRQIWDG